MTILAQALLFWSGGWDLSLTLTPRLVIFWEAAQCRDVLRFLGSRSPEEEEEEGAALYQAPIVFQPLCSMHYFLAEEESKAQRGEATGPRSHSSPRSGLKSISTALLWSGFPPALLSLFQLCSLS